MSNYIKYEDIKHHTVEASHNLNRIPIQVIKHLMAEDWAPLISEGVDGSSLPDMENPHVCITTHLKGRRGGRHPYWVRTVTNDDNPAFFFIHSHDGEVMTQVFVLSKYWTQAVLRLVMDLATTSTDYNYAEQVGEDTEVWVRETIARDIANSIEPPKYEYW